MRIGNILFTLPVLICLLAPAHASDDWKSVAEQLNAMQPTFDNNVAKTNATKTQTIYSELDSIRTRDETKFLADIPNQPGNVQSFLCGYLAERKVKAAVPVLINIYDGLNEKTATPFLPNSIVTTVSHLNGAENRKFFLRVLPSKNIWVRRSAVQALGCLPHDHETVTALRTALLSDADATVRAEAASALGNFPGDAWAKQALEQALGEEQGVIQAIKISLTKLNSRK